MFDPVLSAIGAAAFASGLSMPVFAGPGRGGGTGGMGVDRCIIQRNEVREAFNATQATARWGTGHTLGAFQVVTPGQG